MINELKPNIEDDYSWHEVNCFFRAWSIVLQSYHHSYYNNFLQAMFLNWTFFPESIALSEHDDYMLDSNDEVLTPLFQVRAEKVYYSNEHDFHAQIHAGVQEKHRLIIPGDIFNIYYNASYHTKHNEHFFIIKGCDEQNQRYYILDNLHLKNGASTIYEDFLIPWDILYQSNQLFFSHFQSTSAPYFWSIQPTSLVHSDNTKQVFEANLHILNKYIDTYKDRQLEQMILQSNSKTEQIQQFFMKFNHKNTYFKILKNVFTSLKLDTASFEKWIESFHEIKMKIPISLAGSDSSAQVFQEYSFIEKNLLITMRNLILQYLETAPDQPSPAASKALLQDGVMLNNQNIECLIEHHQLHITHSSHHKSDTWTSENEAFQLLWKNDNSMGDQDLLEVTIENQNEPGLPFHSGIIILYPHEHALYGPMQQVSISLFVPHRLDAYSVKEMQYLKGKVKLKARRDAHRGLLFYFQGPEDPEYVLFTDQPFPLNFTEIGLFSRTWEHIEHTTVFTDITVYNHKLFG